MHNSFVVFGFSTIAITLKYLILPYCRLPDPLGGGAVLLLLLKGFPVLLSAFLDADCFISRYKLYKAASYQCVVLRLATSLAGLSSQLHCLESFCVCFVHGAREL